MKEYISLVFIVVIIGIAYWFFFRSGFFQASSEHSHYYSQWKTVWNKLQEEKRLHGRSELYWEIWHNEVCPAFAKMTGAYEKMGLSNSLSKQVVEDMDKPISQRKYF